jgi:hypothetical protein
VRETATTFLDVAGLVAVALGFGAVTAGGFLLGWREQGVCVVAAGVGAIVAGVILIAGSTYADRRTVAPAPVERGSDVL